MAETVKFNQRDFGKGSVKKIIIRQALPLFVAQLVQLLYNVVDRIYIGHLKETGTIALTGIGLVFPVVTIIAAFTALYSSGGMPLFSMARGSGDKEKAGKLLSNTFGLLLITSIIVTILCYVLNKPLLYAFGASDASYIYAKKYLSIYLIGTPLTMIATGMNVFISAQGFPGIGMATTVIGAIINLILDPVFIYLLGMGVEGAALASIIGQAASCIWVLRFFNSDKTLYKINKNNIIPNKDTTFKICSLGLAGFVMQGTNFATQVACNVMLRSHGGDIYVGVMTIINSVREILTLPVLTATQAAQPVLAFNLGAKLYDRVKEGIRFMTIIGISYSLIAWGIVDHFPVIMMRLFTTDAQLIEVGAPSLALFFFGFCFMAFQFVGQSTFTGLGCAKRAVFFSIFRKLIIVVPLTLLLPGAGFGINGVFIAEPISNLIGGLACFITMYFTLYRRLGKDE